METLSGQPDLLSAGRWQDVADGALKEFGLHEHPTASAIRTRVLAVIDNGRRFLLEGGERRRQVPIRLGTLTVNFEADQAFESGSDLTLRLLRVRPSSVSRIKQPLAALLDAHHAGGGLQAAIEVATLADGQITRVGTIRAPTRERYLQLASQLCEAHFPPSPADLRNCLSCGYLFPCVGPERS